MPTKRIPRASKSIAFFYQEVTVNHPSIICFHMVSRASTWPGQGGQVDPTDCTLIFFFNIYYLALYYILIVVDNITNLQDVEN